MVVTSAGRREGVPVPGITKLFNRRSEERTEMAKKASKKAEEEPLSFDIFYNQERWDNWVKSLGEASFELDPKSDEMPEGFRSAFLG